MRYLELQVDKSPPKITTNHLNHHHQPYILLLLLPFHLASSLSHHHLPAYHHHSKLPLSTPTSMSLRRIITNLVTLYLLPTYPSESTRSHHNQPAHHHRPSTSHYLLAYPSVIAKSSLPTPNFPNLLRVPQYHPLPFMTPHPQFLPSPPPLPLHILTCLPRSLHQNPPPWNIGPFWEHLVSSPSHRGRCNWPLINMGNEDGVRGW